MENHLQEAVYWFFNYFTLSEWDPNSPTGVYPLKIVKSTYSIFLLIQ